MLITTPDLRRTPSVNEDMPYTRNKDPVEFKLDETVIEQRVQLEPLDVQQKRAATTKVTV